MQQAFTPNGNYTVFPNGRGQKSGTLVELSTNILQYILASSDIVPVISTSL